MKKVAKTLIALAAIQVAFATPAEEWCGLKVAPENRCAPYDADRYVYPATLDKRYVEARGYTVDEKGKLNKGFPSPYVRGIKMRYVQSMDIEHIVPRSEAHDSGLCSRPDEWRTFASDMDNITVSSEYVNRTLKSDREPHEWMPDIRGRWYAKTWAQVKAKYGLSVDEAERDALWKALGEKCP